jgi:hypothetical protein
VLNRGECGLGNLKRKNLNIYAKGFFIGSAHDTSHTYKSNLIGLGPRSVQVRPLFSNSERRGHAQRSWP